MPFSGRTSRNQKRALKAGSAPSLHAPITEQIKTKQTNKVRVKTDYSSQVSEHKNNLACQFAKATTECITEMSDEKDAAKAAASAADDLSSKPTKEQTETIQRKTRYNQ